MTIQPLFLVPLAALLAFGASQSPSPVALPARPGSPEAAAGAPPAGVTWSDLDGDGRLDALAVTPEGRIRLLANRAEGVFEDVSVGAGLASIDAVVLALQGDYDGDGRGDLFVGRTAGASLLLRNEGGIFLDVAAVAGLEIEDPVRAAHWLDEDGDGRLDLHVVTSASNRVWRGLAGGSFEPVELPLDVEDAALPSPSTAVIPLPGGAAGGRGPVAPPAEERPTGAIDGLPSRSGPGRQPLGLPPSAGEATPILPFPAGCASSIRDQANPGSCLQASSAATLGMLYPLSSRLFVEEASGEVGINTTTPAYRLHVNGKAVSGESSSAAGAFATVSGGRFCNAGGGYATVAGGRSNRAAGSNATVAGGASNEAPEGWATVGGGQSNVADGQHSTVGGGWSNNAGGSGSQFNTIGGGGSNEISGYYNASNTIGGGTGNEIGGNYAYHNTIGGGTDNYAGGYQFPLNTTGATVAGGRSNTADGSYSAVPGGRSNRAGGPYSFAAGRRAKANHAGSFVWGDSQDIDKPSSNVNEFNVYAESGMRVFSAGTVTPSLAVSSAGSVGVGLAAPSVPLEVAGTVLSSGAAGGRVEAANPNDQAARAHLSWSGDVAGLRVDGSGTGSANGLDFQTGGTSRLRILGDGSVGVGTATPLSLLHVEGGIRSSGASGGQVTCFNPNNQNASFHLSWLSDVARIRVGGSGAGGTNGLDIQTQSDVSLMRLLHNGNVGIGTTTPGFNLEVNGTAGKPGGGSWSVSSDARLKKDVEDLEGALATLLALRGVSFEYIDPAAIGELEGRRIGFLAQEVERVLPDWVGEKENGTKYLTIRGFEALAVEALRELELRNQELARRGAALEQDGAAKDARIAELEARVARLEGVADGVDALAARLAALER